MDEEGYVLLIESYGCLRKAVGKILRSKHRTIKAKNCVEALKLSRGKKVKAVICDIDAVDFRCQKTREQFFRRRGEYFIITGSRGSREKIPGFLKNYLFLPKPYSPEDILKATGSKL